MGLDQSNLLPAALTGHQNYHDETSIIVIAILAFFLSQR
jgi:hypothetical protein